MNRKDFLVSGVGSIVALATPECVARIVKGAVAARETLPDYVDTATSYPVYWVTGDGSEGQVLKIKDADLPLTWDARTGFVIECSMASPGGSFNKCVFQRTYAGSGYLGFSNTWGTIRMWNGKWNYGRYEIKGNRVTANEKHRFKLSADGNCLVDGELFGTTDKVNPTLTSKYDLQILLKTESYFWTDPIYRFKITHDDVVQADFQPWYDNGLYGFKELLTEQFFGNEHIVGRGRIKM